MSALTSLTCYLPNAAKLIPLGFEPVGFDGFGRRRYQRHHYMIAVDCAEGASGEVELGSGIASISRGRAFAGLLPSEAFFDQLLLAIGWDFTAPAALPSTH